MWLKEIHVVVLIPNGSQISHNGDNGVVNYIMGSNAFVAMNTM